jgi:hypothetical protein
MWTNLKSILFSGWNLNRGIRLILGIAILFQYFEQKDFFIAMISGMLILQAVFNVGCCGSGNCAVEPRQTKSQAIEDTTFEEIK